MDRLVAALLAADRIRAAGVAGLGTQGIVAALAMGAADGVDRREIENVEAHRGDLRQAPDHVVEGTVACRVAAFRARKQLVPTGEARQRSLHLHRVFAAAHQVLARADQTQQFAGLRRQPQRHPLLDALAGLQAFGQRRTGGGDLRTAALGAALQQFVALAQLQVQRQACAMLGTHRGGSRQNGRSRPRYGSTGGRRAACATARSRNRCLRAAAAGAAPRFPRHAARPPRHRVPHGHRRRFARPGAGRGRSRSSRDRHPLPPQG